MKKLSRSILTLLLGTTVLSASASVADEWQIPVADANGRVGALMPYTRYDSEEASLGGGAAMKTSTDWNRMNIATQASRQSYVDLPSSGSYAEWTVSTTGRGVTMRFTMPDSGDGQGLNGSLDVYVNGTKVKTVDLTSYYMYQYFSGGNPSDTNDGGPACFAFDEVHFLLDKPLKSGDRIRIQSSGASGLDYGVDFLEIEDVPDEIDCPAGAVNVCDYGAVPDDGKDDVNAFEAAVKAADAGSKIVYIPAGTYHLSRIWNIYCSDLKITGAGIWYTNLKFTNPNRFGGGISGGNGSNGGTDDYCTNLEFCNMYINSSLRSRYNQEAVYKCFMDVFAGGSVIHDIWEDHFECGFWLGDYNGKMGYSDGLKIINCRIRNNLADGVNFCQGTSNAVVYNCNMRNNGDDGLAMWNNNYMNAKDESNNIFCYNTIDFIWRAGGIAIYGGTGHKIYNNYLCDMFMAAGIHLNTTFPGYAFNNNQGISFDNNILVRCGTNNDSWHSDDAAIDLVQNVKNITFNNTQIYDSPFDAIRILNGPTNITFNNTKILGSGISGGDISYSCVTHSAAAIRLQSQDIKFNNTQIANVSPDKKGNNKTWPFWTDNNDALAKSIGAEILEDASYTVPDYPAADKSQGGGVIDPLEGITGYDVALEGLSWENADGSSTLKEGDKVKFTATIRNTSDVDIPAGVQIGLMVQIDGKGSYTNATYKDGLKAGEVIKLSPTATWTAKAGGHEIVATADYRDKLPNELTKDNNNRTKHINVAASTDNVGDYTPVTGGYDLYVTKVGFTNKSINPGDHVVFKATVVNAGDKDIPAGTVIGAQFQINGNTSVITWSDTYSGGLKSHASVVLTANGGTNGANYWTAQNGTFTITAWVDDVNRILGEVNENNNKTNLSLAIPYAAPTFYDNPDSPDNLDKPATGISTVNVTTTPESKVYNLAGQCIGTLKNIKAHGIYIVNGKKILK